MAGCGSSSAKFPELEGRERDRAIREFLAWWIAPRPPRTRLLLEDWLAANPHCRPKRKWK